MTFLSSYFMQNKRKINKVSVWTYQFLRKSFTNTSSPCKVDRIQKRTAAVVVIGDEVLKGHVLDTNTQFLCKGLWNIGVKVVRAAVLPDDVNMIASEISDFSKRYTYVVIAGGIGPTHDDVTYEAVAKAFNEPLILHPEIMQLVSNLYKEPSKIEAGKKMAMLPKSAKMTYGVDPKTGMKTRFPNISVKNVYIFPGIPQLTKYLFTLVADKQFGGSGNAFYHRELFLNAPEVEIVQKLNQFVLAYPSIDFGSYPEIRQSYYNVKLTMESTDQSSLEVAGQKLRDKFCKFIVDYDPNPAQNCVSKLQKFLTCHPQYKEVVNSFQNWFVNAEKPVLIFDGSLESTLLLHLSFTLKNSTKVCYISNLDEERRELMKECSNRYAIKIENVKVNELGESNIISALDLEGVQTYNPLSGLSKKDIWVFVRSLCLCYCPSDDNTANFFQETFKFK